MSKNIFSQVAHNKVSTNVFDLTHDRKFSTKMGVLTPVCVIDTIPGDQFKISSSSMIRFAPLVAPVMHRCNVFVHFFFVPNRLVWSGWEDFITGGEDGLDQTAHPYVTVNQGDLGIGRLADYLGVPTDDEVGNSMVGLEINAIPMAAYQKIFNDYYRDENQMPEELDELLDGDNTANYIQLTRMQNRSWEHDYLTSALPWTQRGPEVMLPLGSTAPLVEIGGNGQQTHILPFGQNVAGSFTPMSNDGTSFGLGLGTLIGDTNAQATFAKIQDTHEADLSQATASSIIELRRAFRLQEWMEKNARAGARYIEVIKSHFDVNSSDKRLQRAEYLGGMSSPVKISEVLQTSSSASDVQLFDTPQGNMAGHGISVGGTTEIGHYSEEHGYIFGIMSVMPKTAYQNGVPKHMLRRDKFDYFWPEFAHIGEQAIENREVYVETDAADQVKTWGYTPRYSEYKYIPDSVHGDFRTDLDFWHMGRKFSALPPLNADFMKMTSDETERIFAVQTTQDNLWIHVLNEIKAKRKMPVFGIPKI